MPVLTYFKRGVYLLNFKELTGEESAPVVYIDAGHLERLKIILEAWTPPAHLLV